MRVSKILCLAAAMTVTSCAAPTSGICIDKEYVPAHTIVNYSMHGHTSTETYTDCPEHWNAVIRNGHRTGKIRVSHTQYDNLQVGDSVIRCADSARIVKIY